MRNCGLNFEARTHKNDEINRFYREELNLQNGWILNFQEIEIESLWGKIHKSEVKTKGNHEKFVWT